MFFFSQTLAYLSKGRKKRPVLFWSSVLLLIFILYIWFFKSLGTGGAESCSDPFGGVVKTIPISIPTESERFTNIVEWKNLLLQRLDRGTLTYLKIQDKDVQREDCDEKCGSTECTVMRERQRNLNACRECHQNPKKCFRPTVSGGNCEDCLEDESQIQCGDTRHFGSANPKDIYSYEGVDPYFMVRTTFSQDSGMSQECVFGHQPENLLG